MTLKITSLTTLLVLAPIALSVVSPSAVLAAESFPERTITILVPF